LPFTSLIIRNPQRIANRNSREINADYSSISVNCGFLY
jgi:hypothetical protein